MTAEYGVLDEVRTFGSYELFFLYFRFMNTIITRSCGIFVMRRSDIYCIGEKAFNSGANNVKDKTSFLSIIRYY